MVTKELGAPIAVGEPVMRLPDRLKRPKLGAHVRAEGLHRRWLKSHGCCVLNGDAPLTSRTCAHRRMPARVSGRMTFSG
jgi:hypothetical protein